MSTDIQAESDLRVKYIRGVQEDRRQREKNQVEMFEDGEQQTGVWLQTAEGHTEKNLPAVSRSWSRAFTVSLGVLCLLTLAGIITRYILVTLEKDQLETRHNNLSDSYNQLQGKLLRMKVNFTQLQDEVKKLNQIIEVNGCPEGWKRFGCSCYFKSTEVKSWYDSRKDCQARGADLVIINSREEQEFVTKLNNNGESWIGLTSTKKNRGYTWEWVDGSPLTQTFGATEQLKHQADWEYVAFCDQQGKWRGFHDSSHSYIHKNWICEK
ncbi:CD209 antigen-like protein E [Seriola aureovittata]|uniref:CD209 antigen-like protein E n=1 Tax=Seriola aureovittata TaxID=2871759 RepID=UPI0024BE1250|nr:CD209 antigen-like protein E [Seriola aureovittata]